MKYVLLIIALFAVGCSTIDDQSSKLVVTSGYSSDSRINFDEALEQVYDIKSLQAMRSALSEQQKIDWIGQQIVRCNAILRDPELARQCAENEANVLRLFTLLPINLVSDDQLLVALEVYNYYRDAQQQRGGSGLVFSSRSVELSQRDQQMVLSQAASPLAIFVVSLRDVLVRHPQIIY